MDQLTWGIIIVSAAVDSINPCVFGVLIFLIAFMTRVFKNPNKMLLMGLLYSLVVYLTYLLFGFGLLRITVNPQIASFFYWLAAFVAIIAGLLEIKDYFWYGRGFSLQIIPGGAERIKYYTSLMEKVEEKNPLMLVLTTLILGVVVVLVELPCTGAPYLAILGLLSKGDFVKAVPMLLIYNFIFVLPLFVIILISYFGVSSAKLEAWRKDNRGLMRLGIGILLLSLGFYMLYSLNPIF